MIDDKGRCCGRKPAIFKRPKPGHRYCGRCNRAYDIEDTTQISNWAWKKNLNGNWEYQVGTLPTKVSSEELLAINKLRSYFFEYPASAEDVAFNKLISEASSMDLVDNVLEELKRLKTGKATA